MAYKVQHEAIEQTKLFNWVVLARGKYPELDMLYHIPNGGSRNKIEAANLRRQGVRSGVPDLCLPVARGNYHGLYIELKWGNINRPIIKEGGCTDLPIKAMRSRFAMAVMKLYRLWSVILICEVYLWQTADILHLI